MLKFKNPVQTSCNGYLPPLWVPFVRRVLFLAIRQGHGSDGAGLPSGSTVSTPCQCHRQGRYKIAHLVTLPTYLPTYVRKLTPRVKEPIVTFESNVTRFGEIPPLWKIFLKKQAIYLRFIWFWEKFSYYFRRICMLLGKFSLL